MKTIKIILITLFILAGLGYLVAWLTVLRKPSEDDICQAITFVVNEEADYGFVNEAEVEAVLKSKGLYPVGKSVKDIDIRRIEKVLEGQTFIAKAECYLTVSKNVRISVSEKLPILHVIANNGDDYYINTSGERMNVTTKSVNVPVATGFITRTYAQDTLYLLAQYLESSPFWKAQVQQIYVTPKQELEIVPRVGQHRLLLGKGTNYATKFDKIKTFYTQALSTVGWNKYSALNIEYDNQIICTKKE